MVCKKDMSPKCGSGDLLNDIHQTLGSAKAVYCFVLDSACCRVVFALVCIADFGVLKRTHIWHLQQKTSLMQSGFSMIKLYVGHCFD